MSLHTIRNLMEKFSNPEINILYFPALSAIDLHILDIPVNYYGNTDISSQNLTNLTELTCASYDFIMTHHLNDTVLNLSNSFHIPILYYVNDKNQIKQHHKNIIYLYDTKTPIEIPNTICINLIDDILVNDVDIESKNDCVFINYHSEKINNKLQNEIKERIPEAVFLDSLPNNISELSKTFSQYKVCVDINPNNTYDTLIALKNKCLCINFYQENSVVLDTKYDNLYYVNQLDDSVYQNLIKFYNTNQFNNDIKLINSQINKNSLHDLSSVYGFMKFRRFVV